MEHYKGLWNRAYLHKGPFTGWQTYYGEIISFNGTGETVAVFKLKKLNLRKGLVFLTVNGNKEDKAIQLKRKKWVQENIVTVNN
jgi:hypothetical protein